MIVFGGTQNVLPSENPTKRGVATSRPSTTLLVVLVVFSQLTPSFRRTTFCQDVTVEGLVTKIKRMWVRAKKKFLVAERAALAGTGGETRSAKADCAEGDDREVSLKCAGAKG